MLEKLIHVNFPQMFQEMLNVLNGFVAIGTSSLTFLASAEQLDGLFLLSDIFSQIEPILYPNGNYDDWQSLA